MKRRKPETIQEKQQNLDRVLDWLDADTAPDTMVAGELPDPILGIPMLQGVLPRDIMVMPSKLKH